MILVYDYFRAYRMAVLLSEKMDSDLNILFKKVHDLETAHNKAITTYNAHMRVLNNQPEE